MRFVQQLRAALVVVAIGCGSSDPEPVAAPAEFVGTWKSRGQDQRLVLTADGRFQWTKGEWTNTGLVTAWTDSGFEISAYPKPEPHVVQVRPHEENGYWWMTVDEVRFWRASQQAEIGKLIPKGEEEAPPEAPAPAPAPAEPAAPAPAPAP